MRIQKYRVAAGCFEPVATHTMAQRLDALRLHVTELLQEQHPDLLVLPETVVTVGLGSNDQYGAEPIDGDTVSMISEIAKKSTTNICIPIIEDEAGDLYNTAVYIGRDGICLGKYRKRVPTSSESETGIRAGARDQQPVLIDGLRVGTAICFDLNFPDLIWDWISCGIDLIVFPSYTYAGELVRNWALNCGVPLIGSFPWESVVYDRDGSVIVKGGTDTSTFRLGHHPAWIACDIDFRRRVYHLDKTQEKLKEISARYGAMVDVRLMVDDGRMMITSISDDMNLDQLEQEMSLVGIQEYLVKSRALAK